MPTPAERERIARLRAATTPSGTWRGAADRHVALVLRLIARPDVPQAFTYHGHRRKRLVRGEL